MDRCIFCGEELHGDTVVCRNCARDLPSPDVLKPGIITQAKSEPEEAETTHKKYIEEEKVAREKSKRAVHRRLLWIVGIVLGFIGFALVGSIVSNSHKYGYAAYVTKTTQAWLTAQSTVRSTQTPIQTPAPLGIPVILGNHAELSVIDVLHHEAVNLGGSYQFIPNPSFRVIDVGVRIVNYSPGDTISFRWNNVYVLEENGDGIYPIWGSVKPVRSGEVIDPFDIELNAEEIDGNEMISFDNDAYLRLIYIVRDIPQDMLFGIGNSPQINFTVE
jgi:hypothetical protein